MMRSMYAGVSGLKVHQTRMDIIGNNISNVNTTGYKASRVTFKEMLSQTLTGAKAPQNNQGGMNPQQVGLGVVLGSIDTNMTQGNSQTTNLTRDLLINGNGYFIVNDGTQNFYTRAGALDTDEDGNLVNTSNGYIMQGWMANNNGVINTNGQIDGIQIPLGATISPQASQNAYFTGNFDSDAAGGTNWTATIDVFDSLGSKHTVAVDFVRQITSVPDGQADFGGVTGTVTATSSAVSLELNGLTIKFGADSDAAAAASYDVSSNTITVTADWDDSATLAPADMLAIQNVINAELGSEGFTDTVTLTSGAFDASEFDGAPDIVLLGDPANQWDYEVRFPDNSPISAGANGSISFNSDGSISSGATNTITFDPVGGAAGGQNVTLDFSALTQSSANGKGLSKGKGTTVEKLNVDGNSMGSLKSFNIEPSGVIYGHFTNGLRRVLGQIAVASFTNPSGLIRQGDTLYSESQNSGLAQVGTADTSGRGTIVSGKLEMSNVDLAEQFTDMITTQRGFQANSKIITVADEMLQDLVNLKR